MTAIEIRIWHAFSCNNSSSYRLVARFADAKTAKEAEEELRQFFAEHAKEADAAMDEGGDAFERPMDADVALAKKYGFKWNDMLAWGDSEQEGDEPEVVSEGDVLVIYHSYCAGGFGDDLPKYFAKRGAKIEDDSDGGPPTVSVLFKLPQRAKEASELRKELAAVFAQAGWISKWKKKLPWAGDMYSPGEAEETAFFCDGKSVGFYLPTNPDDVGRMREFLQKRGVTDLAIVLCREDDLEKFQTIAAAKCDACGHAPLEYIEAGGESTIESEQLACAKCGGMFELDGFKPGAAAPAPAAKVVAKKTKTKK